MSLLNIILHCVTDCGFMVLVILVGILASLAYGL